MSVRFLFGLTGKTAHGFVARRLPHAYQLGTRAECRAAGEKPLMEGYSVAFMTALLTCPQYPDHKHRSSGRNLHKSFHIRLPYDFAGVSTGSGNRGILIAVLKHRFLIVRALVILPFFCLAIRASNPSLRRANNIDFSFYKSIDSIWLSLEAVS